MHLVGCLYYNIKDARSHKLQIYFIKLLLCFTDELNWIEFLKYVKSSGPGNG